MARVVWGQNESRFGVVELFRDSWHKVGSDLPSIREDRELIATESLIGEDVGGEVVGFHVGKM
jgi:hypothetical protein